MKAGKEKIKNLKHIVAISPAIDPLKSMIATDRTLIIRKYFLKKMGQVPCSKNRPFFRRTMISVISGNTTV